MSTQTAPKTNREADAVSLGPMGLDEARRRLRRHGSNTLQEKRSRSVLDILRGGLREPMFLLLLAAAALYLALGDIGEGPFMIVGAVATIFYVPPLASILRVSPPSLSWLATTLTLAALAGGWFGLAKRLRSARASHEEQRTPA